jgi:hypothetical protein
MLDFVPTVTPVSPSSTGIESEHMSKYVSGDRKTCGENFALKEFLFGNVSMTGRLQTEATTSHLFSLPVIKTDKVELRVCRAEQDFQQFNPSTGRPYLGSLYCVYYSRTISPSHYSGDGNLISASDVRPHAQNLTRFIYVLWMADGQMNHSKSDHYFNLENRGSHVRIDARASLRAERRTE